MNSPISGRVADHPDQTAGSDRQTHRSDGASESDKLNADRNVKRTSPERFSDAATASQAYCRSDRGKYFDVGTQVDYSRELESRLFWGPSRGIR